MITHNGEQQKVFVDQEGMSLITCPACSREKSVRVNPSAIRGNEVRNCCNVRCSCQARFAVELEFRRDPRKDSDLKGEFLCMPRGKPRGELTVVNISQTGIGVQVENGHQFIIGAELLVWFTLDGNNDSLIEKRVIIRRVKEDLLGCEFVDSSPPGSALGDFLASIVNEDVEGYTEPEAESETETDEDGFDWSGSFFR